MAGAGCALLLLWAASRAAAADPAAPGATLATPDTLRDFMIQDVCLNAQGAVVPGTAAAEKGAVRWPLEHQIAF